MLLWNLSFQCPRDYFLHARLHTLVKVLNNPCHLTSKGHRSISSAVCLEAHSVGLSLGAQLFALPLALSLEFKA